MIGQMVYSNMAALGTLLIFLFSRFHFMDGKYPVGDTKGPFFLFRILFF